MIVSAGYLRAMKIDIPMNIPDCAMTTAPTLSSIASSYNEETRMVTIDATLDFTSPFNWVTLELIVRKASVSRNKREGKFIGVQKFYNADTRQPLKPQYRQGTGVFKNFSPLSKRKKIIKNMIANGY